MSSTKNPNTGDTDIFAFDAISSWDPQRPSGTPFDSVVVVDSVIDSNDSLNYLVSVSADMDLAVVATVDRNF